MEFETRWTEYLALRMEGIAKPVRSVNNRLYEVAGAGGKTYILSLQEKAPGKIVDINDPKEFNEELFFQLGMLMGRMHKLTMCYEQATLPRIQMEWPAFLAQEYCDTGRSCASGRKEIPGRTGTASYRKLKIMGLSILISTPTIFLSKIKE